MTIHDFSIAGQPALDINRRIALIVGEPVTVRSAESIKGVFGSPVDVSEDGATFTPFEPGFIAVDLKNARGSMRLQAVAFPRASLDVMEPWFSTLDVDTAERKKREALATLANQTTPEWCERAFGVAPHGIVAELVGRRSDEGIDPRSYGAPNEWASQRGQHAGQLGLGHPSQTRR